MTYWAILEKVKGSQLRLTKMDDEIYDSFKVDFPDFDPAAPLNEDEMKSKAGKEKWRNWINKFDKKIEDFNFGTIIRLRPDVEYDEDTTLFGKLSWTWEHLEVGTLANSGIQVFACNSMLLRLLGKTFSNTRFEQ